MATKRFVSIIVIAGSLIAAAGVQADDFDLSWHTIDGGGQTVSGGGDFELSGAIGQPDAGTVMTGGDFALSGGFWAGAVLSGVERCIGDLNNDGRTDLADSAILTGCMDGPGQPLAPGCVSSDLDTDGDADLADFALFQAAFGCP